MSEETPRFELAFIIPGQAQKELFHNEALTTIDLLLQAAVEGPVPTIPLRWPPPGNAGLSVLRRRKPGPVSRISWRCGPTPAGDSPCPRPG